MGEFLVKCRRKLWKAIANLGIVNDNSSKYYKRRIKELELLEKN